MVSVCAPVAASSATRSPGFAPRAFISGNSTGATAAMSAAFEPEMPGNQIHRADQHVMQSAANMAQQASQKRHHGPGHAGHFDQKAEKHKQRHREQNEVAHALVHTADQHHQRCPRRQSEISENGQSETEGDRHAGEDTEAGHADKEDDQVEIAKRTQPGCASQNAAISNATDSTALATILLLPVPCQPDDANSTIRPMPDRQRGGAPDVGDLQRRSGDEAFLVGVFVRGPRDQQQKGKAAQVATTSR